MQFKLVCQKLMLKVALEYKGIIPLAMMF